MLRGRKRKYTARKTAVFEWMLLRLMSEQPVSERKRYAFAKWLAEETNEDFKWSTVDRVFMTEYGRV